ncbi:MAG TPA: hypothetical protein VN554_01640, partial [Verrucomicrobiae bacterium]|nr:hypothetical protein [Verrucomicrobiae bacterium]
PTTLGAGFNENLANDNLTTVTYPVPCTQSSLYNISIVSRGGGVFDFRVRWFGTGNLGRQQEELTYKLGTIAASFTGGYIDPEVPPPPPFSGSVSVVVKAIPQTGPSGTTANPTPPCTNPAGNLSGTTVRMNGLGGPFTKSTDVSSVATFNTLQQGTGYTASITRSGWQVCSITGSPATASATAPVPVVNATIRPICQVSYYNNYYDYYRDAGLDGYWSFSGSLPDSAYTSAYYDQYGGLHTSPYPWFWYFVGSPTYQWINGSLYRYYWVYDAYYHNEPIYGCPS